MQSFHKNQDEPYEYRGRTLNLAQNFRMLTQQCLLLAEYNKPEHSMIETFILHLHGEYTKTGDADVGLWVRRSFFSRGAFGDEFPGSNRHGRTACDENGSTS